MLCGARWYNPWTARWMTRDPIGYAGGADLYAYCGESPVVAADPSGLDCGGGGGSWLGVESAPPPGGDGLSGWDLLPVIGPGRDIFYGIENGDPLRLGLGIVGMALDVGSLGTDVVEKDAGEIAIKEAVRDVAEKGIYDVPMKGRRYVGQSINMTRRLGEHVAEDRITQEEADSAMRFEVEGGKTEREIQEQLRIDDEYGGIGGGQLENERNPIGRKRFSLMPPGYRRP